MKMNKIIAMVILGAVVSACGGQSTGQYDETSFYGERNIRVVEIISKKRVRVNTGDNGDTGAGVAAGAGLGAGLATMNGDDAVAGAVVGAIVGGLLASADDGEVKDGYEYIVKDERGKLRGVLVENGDLRIGDWAYLILSDKPKLRFIERGERQIIRKNRRLRRDDDDRDYDRRDYDRDYRRDDVRIDCDDLRNKYDRRDCREKKRQQRRDYRRYSD